MVRCCPQHCYSVWFAISPNYAARCTAKAASESMRSKKPVSTTGDKAFKDMVARRIDAKCARDKVAADVRKYCYGKHCLRKLGCQRLRGIRETFFAMTKGTQEQHLQDHLHEEEAVSATRVRTIIIRLPQLKEPVCVRSFVRLFCIGAGRFRNVRYKVEKGLTWVSTPSLRSAPTSYGLLAVQWLNAFILRCVERLPTSSKRLNNKVRTSDNILNLQRGLLALIVTLCEAWPWVLARIVTHHSKSVIQGSFSFVAASVCKLPLLQVFAPVAGS